MEEWKFYKETNSGRWGHRVYEVSNFGRAKVNGRLMELKMGSDKFVWCEGAFKIHRAVAEVFIPNPENKPEIDHIDTDRWNNNVNNLRWVTGKENMNNPLTLIKLKERPHHEGWNKGQKGLYPSWCKGLTKETDERVATIAQKLKVSCSSDKVRKERSERMNGDKNPQYGKPSFFKGKKHSDKSKEQNRQSHKGLAKGTVWMNNGKDQMMVFPPWDQDMLIFGWQYGRLKKNKKNKKEKS